MARFLSNYFSRWIVFTLFALFDINKQFYCAWNSSKSLGLRFLTHILASYTFNKKTNLNILNTANFLLFNKNKENIIIEYNFCFASVFLWIKATQNFAGF
jgi:hypothetical protein